LCPAPAGATLGSHVGRDLRSPLCPASIALTLSELACFTAGGLVIGVTPIFVTGPLASDAAALGLVAGAYGVATLLLSRLNG